MHQRHQHEARARVGEHDWAATWNAGRALPLHEVLNIASEPPTANHRSRPFPAGLTSREVEVLRLTAEGLTNAQVADQLGLSPRTIGQHLRSIYTKLDVSSRTAATRFAIEHDLI